MFRRYLLEFCLVVSTFKFFVHGYRQIYLCILCHDLMLREQLTSFNFSPNVVFCGYSIPHPAEDVMHFRVETNGNVSAADVFRQGIQNIIQLSDHMIESFQGEIASGKFPFDNVQDP
jgi:DNA-directed RNA polymerase subunit L